jgi:hypothetical protein
VVCAPAVLFIYFCPEYCPGVWKSDARSSVLLYKEYRRIVTRKCVIKLKEVKSDDLGGRALAHNGQSILRCLITNYKHLQADKVQTQSDGRIMDIFAC